MIYRRPFVREEASRQWLAAITLGVLGSLAVLAMGDSPFLPAAHADSVGYMEAGMGLVNGRGLSLPMGYPYLEEFNRRHLPIIGGDLPLQLQGTAAKGSITALDVVAYGPALLGRSPERRASREVL